MFAHCCGDATIVARGQPLFSLIKSPFQFERTLLDGRQPKGDCSGIFPDLVIDGGTARARPTLGARASPLANRETKALLSPRTVRQLRRHCVPNVAALDSHRREQDRVIFVRAGTFCARFGHAMTRSAPSASALRACILKQEQCGTQFFRRFQRHPK
jgi:hypothetical protein